MLSELASPFARESYKPESIHALTALPFYAIVTTNYDRSLHDAYAAVKHCAPATAELGDATLRQALYRWNSFYIARIHGRAEVPESIVVSTEDYSRAEQNPDYTDFLFHVLTRTSCLFLGYSFLDPAIDRILKIIRDRIGLVPLTHTALVPAEGGEKLAAELSRFSIEVCLYEQRNSHEALWKAVRLALNSLKTIPPSFSEPYPEPLDLAKRLLACCYARLKMGESAQSLQDVVAEGIVLALVAEKEGSALSELAEALRKYIPLTAKESEGIVRERLNSLVDRKWIAVNPKGDFKLARDLENQLDRELDTLVESVADRLLVRESHVASPDERALLRKILEEVVLLRGWDMGANLAAARPPDSDLMPLLRNVITSQAKNVGPATREKLAAASYALFQSPSLSESELLVSLGRLAFGVELALQRGRSSLLYPTTLPERIYLDANVLMPAIVKGHPYHATYVAAIQKLHEAQAKVGGTSKVMVIRDFLNEIIAHRQRAQSIVRENDLEKREILEKYILFVRSTENCNVFVGAYANYLATHKENISFAGFLNSEAPYRNEEALSEFLNNRMGIETVDTKASDSAHFPVIHDALLSSYMADSGGHETKPLVLIEHEAKQLTKLEEDLNQYVRTVFVTADERLRRVVVGKDFDRVAPSLISHLGLIQLIDLLVGMDAEPQSLVRILWAVQACDEKAQLRNYFVDLALRHYEPAEARKMNDILDDIVDEASREAKKAGISLSDSKNPVAFKFLDRFEDKFFGTMADMLRKGRDN